MKTTATPTLLLLAALAACGLPDEPDSILLPDDTPLVSPEMMAEARSFDRAPFSPPGWPLEVGDSVSWGMWTELDERFPDWHEVRNVYWRGGKLWGAFWLSCFGDRPHVYAGHFPTQTRKHPDYWHPGWIEAMPPNLRHRYMDFYNPKADGPLDLHFGDSRRGVFFWGYPLDTLTAGTHRWVEMTDSMHQTGPVHLLGVNFGYQKDDAKAFETMKHELAHHAGFADTVTGAQPFTAYDLRGASMRRLYDSTKKGTPAVPGDS